MRYLLLVSTALFLQTPAFAHTGGHDHHHGHQHSASCAHAEPASHREVIRQLIDIFHHAIDGEHDHDATWKDKLRDLTRAATWKKWFTQLNPVRISANSYRAYHMQKNKAALAEHAMNLALVFPLSHGLEMIAGPAFGVAANALDLPTSVVAGGSSALSLIAIPGLDPLCFLIMAAYPLKPVHGSLTVARRGMQWVTRAAMVRLKHAFPERFEPGQDLLEFLSQTETEVVWAETFRIRSSQIQAGGAAADLSSQVIELLDADGSSLLELQFRTEGEGHDQDRFLAHLTLPGDVEKLQAHKRTLLRFASLFHWNVRVAIREAVHLHTRGKLSTLSEQFYVQSVDAAKVQYTPRAVRMPHTRVAREFKDCAQLLKLGTAPRPGLEL